MSLVSFTKKQAKDDFYLMSELVRDYVGIVGSVKEAFQVGKSAPTLQLINCAIH